jgi:2Fe-2S ferredoxin
MKSGTIRVTDRAGETHEVPALEGWRVMEIIRDHGLDIDGLCGGACACATCHVHVQPDWERRLPAASDEEEGMLDELPAFAPGSRLSCQIIWSPALDGLEVALAASD